MQLKMRIAGALPGRFLVSGRTSGRREVALTFDDGPHPLHTPRLLDRLRRHDIQATFFVTGKSMEAHPEIGRRIRGEGHQVANHGYSHLHAGRVACRQYLRDIAAGHDAIEQVLGESVARFVRPPYGALTLPTLAGMLVRGYRIALWSIDSMDHAVTDLPGFVERLAQIEISSGDIVLLHDDYGHTVDGLEDVLRKIGDLRPVTIERISGLASR